MTSGILYLRWTQTQTFLLFYFVFKHLKTIWMQFQCILHTQHLQVYGGMPFLWHKFLLQRSLHL